MRSSHFSRNAASPTASTSSSSTISASTVVAMAKASRAIMPVEYVRSGASMKSAMPEKSMISSSQRRMNARERPRSEPLKRMFSRPDSSPSKPVPSSMIGASTPRVITSPSDGGMMPAITRSSVDFPAPLPPMIPNASPGSSDSETPSSARNGFRPVLRRSAHSFRLGAFWAGYETLMSRQMTELMSGSQMRIKTGGHAAEREPADQQRRQRQRDADAEQRARGKDSCVNRDAHHLDQVVHRIRAHHHLELRRHDLQRPDDRRQIHHRRQRHREHLPHVDEVDRDRREREREAEREDRQDGDRDRQKQHRRTERHAAQEHDQHQRDVRDHEIDHARDRGREREDR